MRVLIIADRFMELESKSPQSWQSISARRQSTHSLYFQPVPGCGNLYPEAKEMLGGVTNTELGMLSLPLQGL